MEQPRPAVIEDFVSHLDDALDAAVGGEADGALTSADRLAKALPAIEAWREQLGSGTPLDEVSVRAVREMQQKAYRLARVVRHIQSVRQGLSDIGRIRADCYERDGRVQSSDAARLRVDG